MILISLVLQMLLCLANPPAPFLTEWGHSEGKWLSEQTWDTLQTVTGDDLWIGYENGGWNTAGDEYGRYKLSGDGYEIWWFYSPTRQQYELFPFTNLEPFADANGDHYGLHPCGGWAVDELIIDEIIGE